MSRADLEYSTGITGFKSLILFLMFGKVYFDSNLCRTNSISLACYAMSVMSNSAIVWIVALQIALSMRLSRQEYWSGLPCPPPGDLPYPGIEPRSPESSALQAILYHLGSPGSMLARGISEGSSPERLPTDRLPPCSRGSCSPLSPSYSLGNLARPPG